MDKKLLIILIVIILFFSIGGLMVLNYNNVNKARIFCDNSTRHYEITNYTTDNNNSFKPTSPYPPIKYK